MRYLSLFSGIEAASVAWEPLGWKPMAFSEIEPFPCAVLRERYPDVPNLGDITMIDWSDFIVEHGRPDLVVGGSPCQSFSIAGTRTGLAGASGLMYEYIRAIQELRPRWLLWENVPGALSVEQGHAFGQLLSSLDDCGYGLAWRVLDAQFCRVPMYSDTGELVGFVGPVAQRRRRVFLVGCLVGGCAAEVLLESEGMSGNSSSSREKRKNLARTIGRGVDNGGDAGSLTPWDNQAKRVFTSDSVCPTLNSGADTNNTHIQPTVLQQIKFAADTSTQAYALRMRSGKEGGGKGPLVQHDVSGTLATGNDQTIFALCTGHSGANGSNVNEENIAYILSLATDQALAYVSRDYKDISEDTSHVIPYEDSCLSLAVTISNGSEWVVRRLTPIECERLMGFPDGFTDIGEWVDDKGKTRKPADGPRYKALGNSFAVPVIRWIGERIEEVDIWL